MSTPLEVLLVEDNEGDVEMMQRAFRSDEPPLCNISVTNDGVEALNFLHKQENFESAPTPQLILLDLNMPRMGGKQFLEVIKTEKALKSIPVIVFTSSSSQADIQECYERHASCYIVKPFNSKDFMVVLRQAVSFWKEMAQMP